RLTTSPALPATTWTVAAVENGGSGGPQAATSTVSIAAPDSPKLFLERTENVSWSPDGAHTFVGTVTCAVAPCGTTLMPERLVAPHSNEKPLHSAGSFST